jgi:hypothetical protein
VAASLHLDIFLVLQHAVCRTRLNAFERRPARPRL